jgi:hypothetical protein
MRSYVHNHLLFQFNELWITNRARNTDFRNADDLFFVPIHKMASVKRFPYFGFPKLWNDEPITILT